MIHFEIKATNKKSRRGILKIKDSVINTPYFMPQSTGLNIKAMFAETVKELGYDMLFCDLYVPLMRIGLDNIFKQGGLNKVTGNDGILFLTSGASGIAASGMAYKAKEDGVDFASYVDGSKHKLSPESCIRISQKFGADIVAGLYEHPINAAGSRKKIGGAVRRTTRWTKRAMEVYASLFSRSGRAGDSCFFAPVTGGSQGDLRLQSATEAAKLSPDGFLQVQAYEGEPRKAWLLAVAASMARLPDDKPAAIFGINSLDELKEAVAIGIDLVGGDFPITDGLQGILYTDEAKGGFIDIKDDKYTEDKGKINPNCPCPACQDFTLAYLHHLFTADELLGPRLAVWHNLCYMRQFMEKLQKDIG